MVPPGSQLAWCSQYTPANAETVFHALNRCLTRSFLVSKSQEISCCYLFWHHNQQSWDSHPQCSTQSLPPKRKPHAEVFESLSYQLMRCQDGVGELWVGHSDCAQHQASEEINQPSEIKSILRSQATDYMFLRCSKHFAHEIQSELCLKGDPKKPLDCPYFQSYHCMLLRVIDT